MGSMARRIVGGADHPIVTVEHDQHQNIDWHARRHSPAATEVHLPLKMHPVTADCYSMQCSDSSRRLTPSIYQSDRDLDRAAT